MKQVSRLSVAVLCFLFAVSLFAVRPAAAQDVSYQDLWKKVNDKWENDINSYQCDLFSYVLRTDSFIKNFPEYTDPDDKPDWDYNVFKIKFKKPTKTLLLYYTSLNEDFESGSIIDKGIAYMLAYTKGTTLNYGYKDMETVYIVFPYLTNKQFGEMPIALMWKAALKILMIASRKEVYHKTPEELRDMRGFELADISIGRTIKRYEPWLKESNITVAKSPLYTIDDFDIDTKTGLLKMKSGVNRPANVYKLTLIPKNPAASKGITKIEIFVDPATDMFAGLMEYEATGLVHVKLFSNLRLNPDLPDKQWEDFFKGRTLSDKG